MFDRILVKEILLQVSEAIIRIQLRTSDIKKVSFFTDTPTGMEKFDAVCMLLLTIGESIKNIDKITKNFLLIKYPEIDWVGIKGFRDVVAHHYFDIDAEQVFWIIKNNLEPLKATIKKMIDEL